MSPASDDIEIYATVEPVTTIAVRVDPPTVHVVLASNVGPQGPTILSGGTTPTPADGVPGQFYLDQSASILYGPKDDAGEWPIALRGA